MINLQELKSKLISEKFGIIRLLETETYALNRKLYVSMAEGKRFHQPMVTCGIDFNKNQSEIKALVEGVERYSSLNFEPKESLYESTENMSGHFFKWDSFANFAHHQRAQLQNSEVIEWVKCVDFNNDSFLVPKSAVFLKNSQVSDFVPVSSSGTAGGYDISTVKLNALLETIERDSYINHWRSFLPPKEIVLDDSKFADEEILSILRHMPKQKMKFRLFSLENEIRIPVVLAVGEGISKDWPAITASAACHPCAMKALKKALYELALVHHIFYQDEYGGIDFSKPCPLQERDILSFKSHTRYYYYYDNMKIIKDFLTTSKKIQFEELESEKLSTSFEQLNQLDRKLKTAGYVPLYFDHTTRDIREIGLHVWRNLIPGFSIINGSQRQVMLGEDRFKRFYETFGNGLGQFKVNAHPHFFP